MNATTLSPPKNSRAEILAGLITQSEISERDFSQNGFRMRLTEIRRMGLPIQEKFITRKGKFGKTCTYKVRYLFTLDLPKALELYNRINN